MSQIKAKNPSEADALVLDAAISAGAIYRLADMIYDLSLGQTGESGAQAGALATAIKESAARIEQRAEAVSGFLSDTLRDGGPDHG